MKKIFAILAMAAAMLFTSCNQDDLGFIYNVTVEGQADGVVSYVVPSVEGRFTANGDLFLKCSNDTTLTRGAMPLGAALGSEESEVAKAAEETLNWVDSAFSFDGDYHVRVHGYVKYLGVTLEIDEELPKETD